MNFESPNALLGEAQSMLEANQTVMRNRTLINRLFNGEPPHTEAERMAENIKVNVNWLEATRIAANATNQLNNAFFRGGRFFSVIVDKGDPRKRHQYAASITKHINNELKNSTYYRGARESAHAQVVLHGPGPLVWRNRRCPIPDAAGLEDILVPQGTLTSMENLDRFAIYRELNWNQLVSQTQGKTHDPGWNRPYVTALLAHLYKTGVTTIYQGNRWEFPEKLHEDLKEGAASGASSSLPKVMAYDFFYREDDDDKWTRKMMLDFGTVDELVVKSTDPLRKNQEFMYEKKGYASDWTEVVHWYIGNCSNVAPFRYYSTRSIGYLLYGVCLIQNKLRNRFTEHTFQSLLTLFRNVSDDNREKLGMIDLHNLGVMPDGVSMVPAQERHVIDANLVMLGLNQGRQLMAESAQSFVPDMQGDSKKQMTATETLVRQNTSVSLTSAVLNQLSEQSRTEYREICRRFCIKDNPDPMAKRFRENIKKDGVPMDCLDIDAWEVLPEQTVGGGNKAVELTVTQALMQEILPMADPDGQRLIGRRRYLALTDNPEEAMAIFPDAPQPPSDDVQYAQVAYAVLMLGQPFAKKEGVNHVAYTGMLMQMMNITLAQIQQATEQPNGAAIAADKIVGMFNVVQHVQEEINIIARVEAQVPKAKIMFKALVEMIAELTKVAQALMAKDQEQQGNGGLAAETQAKIQTMIMKAQTENQIKQMQAQEKEQRNDIKFHNENLRRNAMVEADNQRKMIGTAADIQAKDLTTSAEIIRESNKPQPAGTSK
jgi:hypothetical protein